MDDHRVISEIYKNNTHYSTYFSLVRKQCPAMHEKLTQAGPKYAENIYLYVNQIDVPHCKTCNNRLQFKDRSDGYGTYCSHRCYSNDPDVVTNRKNTNLKKYGCANVMSSSTVQQKHKNTMLANYGVEHALQHNGIMQKQQKSYLENNTKDSTLNARQATCMKRYGTTIPQQLSSVKNKTKATNLLKYGSAHVQQVSDIKLKSKKTKACNFFNNLPKRCPDVAPQFTEFTGVDSMYLWECLHCRTQFHDHIDDGSVPMCPECHPKYAGSAGEQEVNDFVRSLGEEVVNNDRDILSPKEIDIVVPRVRIAIEYNGLYWHGSNKIKSHTYHRDKMVMCHEKGYQLITIFEDEWQADQARCKNRIRELVSPQVPSKTVEIGQCPDHSEIYAFCDNRQVASMSFVKTGDSYEITCNTTGYENEMFAYFILHYRPSTVTRHRDLRWFNNSVDEFGLILTHTSDPTCKYSSDGITRCHAEERLSDISYYEIWDCGFGTYTWQSL